MKPYRNAVLFVRHLWAMAVAFSWCVASLIVGCTIIDEIAKKRPPGDPFDGAMTLFFVFVFIGPLSGAICAIAGVIIWAPVDLLLGLLMGRPKLLPYELND